MKFKEPLIPGKFLQRYKRFFVDVELHDGSIVTAHCPNTGSMKSCYAPGWSVLLSRQNRPERKLKYTLEMISNGQCWIGVNTQIPNSLVIESLRDGTIKELITYNEFKPEVNYGYRSRLDILAENASGKCFIEVKNVTLVDEKGFYSFPDAVTKRGVKHLRHLIDVLHNGHHAALVFTIQRSDGTVFRPAAEIDPEFTKYLKLAHTEGMKILPYIANVTPKGIKLAKKVDSILF